MPPDALRLKASETNRITSVNERVGSVTPFEIAFRGDEECGPSADLLVRLLVVGNGKGRRAMARRCPLCGNSVQGLKQCSNCGEVLEQAPVLPSAFMYFLTFVGLLAVVVLFVALLIYSYEYIG